MDHQTTDQWQNGSEVFYILHNQKIVAAEKNAPEEFYVKGLMENGEFLPKSSVLGMGELASDGRYGWLELLSKEFFPMESDKKAATPFVKGYMTGNGFVPSLRDVFEEP